MRNISSRQLAHGVPALLLIGLVGCGGTNGTTVGSPSYSGDILTSPQRQEIVSAATKLLNTGTATKVTTGLNDFGFSLLRHLTASPEVGNVCISPISVQLVMAQLYSGAAGETQKQIAQAVGTQKVSGPDLEQADSNLLSVLQNVDPEKVRLDISNSLWIDASMPINPDFVKKDEETYKAKVSTLDFHSAQAPATINDWVSQSTNGKIKSIVDKVPGDAKLFAINAVFFKGKWANPFEKERTHQQEFTLPSGKTKSVSMMTQTVQADYFANGEVTGIVLPYGAGRIEMVIVLPAGKGDLSNTLKALSGSTWHKWLKDKTKKMLYVTIPKFQSDYSAGLNSALQSLGVKDAFDASRANFSSMLASGSVASGRLVLSDVQHKTYIAVDEEGTEAAAATSGMIRATAVPMTTNFTADHPFLYVIRDSETGTFLFAGILTDPVAPAPLAEKKS